MYPRYNCCFSGHRPTKLPYGYDEEHPNCITLKLKLASEIEQMRKKGVTTFLTGMAQGPDIWCAELVLDLKHAYPDAEIQLIAVLPFEGQADRWHEAYRERYFSILARADDVFTLQAQYTKGCMQRRNRYLVDSSAHMIAVYSGKRGATQFTVDYAVQKGLDIVILNPDTLEQARPGEKPRNNIIRFER